MEASKDIESARQSTEVQTNYGGTAEGEPPPTYQEAIEPPPSYSSIFGEIKDVRHSASSVPDFLYKLVILLISTIGCTIAIGILMAIPITMIVLGAKYKDDCPIEKHIPIYLIVGGSFGIFRNFISLCKRGKKHGQDGEEEESRKNPLEAIIDCFLFAWFIAGNVWIYSNYKPNFDNSSSSNYCNKTLYLFAFWLTNTTYILMAVTCLCLCCAGICAAILG